MGMALAPSIRWLKEGQQVRRNRAESLRRRRTILLLRESQRSLDDAAEAAEPQAGHEAQGPSKADAPLPPERADRRDLRRGPKSRFRRRPSRRSEGQEEHRPIIAVCPVLLLSSVDNRATIDDKFFSQGDTSAANAWDTVEVVTCKNFYGYYDEGGMVFDTSIESIGKNADYLKSYSFEKTSYSKLSFTIGQGKMLTGFENALLGMRPGETVRIAIPVGEGYGDGTSFNGTYTVTGLKTDLVLSMTKDECTAY